MRGWAEQNLFNQTKIETKTKRQKRKQEPSSKYLRYEGTGLQMTKLQEKNENLKKNYNHKN